MSREDVERNRKNGRRSHASAVEASVTVILFAVALVAWSAVTLIHDPGLVSKSENHYLAALPPFPEDPAQVSEYLHGLEAYLDDHLAFREFGIWLNGWIKLNWLGTSPHPNVRLGSEGWLFNARSFSRPCAATWSTAGIIQNLSALEEAIAQRGLPMIALIAPSKFIVYPEFPGSLKVRSQCAKVRSDELRHAFGAGSSSHRLDVRTLLAEARERDDREALFWSNDSHWSDRAAKIVAKK